MSEYISNKNLYNDIHDKLAHQAYTFGTKLIVTSDIDDTVYSHANPFTNGPNFENFLRAQLIPFAAITGRHAFEVMDYINKGKLTFPPAILSSRNGTMIYIAQQSAFDKHEEGTPVTIDDYKVDQKYSDWIVSLGFDKRQILSQTQGWYDAVRSQVPEAWLEHQFADRPDKLETLGMVSDANQVIWDIELPGPRNTHDSALNHITQVSQEIFRDLSVILMEGGPAKQSRYTANGVAYGLFVLGQGVGKHSAIEHIIKRTGASAATFMGDHLNDLSALTYNKYTVPVYRGVVGGARPVLLDSINPSPNTLIDIHSDRIASQSALYIVQQALIHLKGGNEGYYNF